MKRGLQEWLLATAKHNGAADATAGIGRTSFHSRNKERQETGLVVLIANVIGGIIG